MALSYAAHAGGVKIEMADLLPLLIFLNASSVTVQMQLMDKWFFMYFGCEVLGLIDSRRTRGGRPREESIKRTAREVAAHPYFRQLNQRARRYYAGAAPVPTADVRAHTRNGWPVRSHFRCYGYAHLLELPLGEYEEFVGRVVRALVAMRRYGNRD